MKKTLIALAALAASSVALAQNVTLSGAVAGQQNKVGSAKAVTSIAVSELTFRAAEDLGGGLKANAFFTIENMNNRGTTATSSVVAGGDSHSHTVNNGPTNADSGITLAGGFGSVSLTNTRSSNMAVSANVFGTSISNGFYDSVASRTPIQALSYTSPELMKGLRLSVAQVNVGNSAASQVAKTTVVGASYAAGPLSLGVQNKSLNSASAPAGTEDNQFEGFVRYDAGVVVVGLGYGSKTTTTGDTVVSYGISAPMGAFTFGLEGAKRDTAEFMNYGVRYALSKRTALHVSAGKFQAASAASQSQRRIRISHSF